MNTSIAEEIRWPAIMRLTFTEAEMHVHLSDGRVITVPLVWYQSLADATREQLENYEIAPGGYGVHWPDLDEDLSVRGFLMPPAGRKSD